MKRSRRQSKPCPVSSFTGCTDGFSAASKTNGIDRLRTIPCRDDWISWLKRPYPSIALVLRHRFPLMKSRATRSFWKQFHNLPKDIQATATREYRLWSVNPKHQALRFKKVGGQWSARITDDYRALGIMAGDTMIWYFIGTHTEYDRLLKKK